MILCAFFDFEATGLHVNYAEIVEIATIVRLLLPDGTWQPLRDGSCNDFRILVRPTQGKLPRKVAQLTGLSNSQLQRDGCDFRAAVTAWLAWLRAQVAKVAAATVGSVELWLVGHNVLGYDLPLLLAQDARERQVEMRRTCGLRYFEGLFQDFDACTGFVDSLRLSRALARSGKLRTPSHRLEALHHSTLGRPLASAHTALGDAKGLLDVCAELPFCTALALAIADARATPHLSGCGAVLLCDALASARLKVSRATWAVDPLRRRWSGRRMSRAEPSLHTPAFVAGIALGRKRCAQAERHEEEQDRLRRCFGKHGARGATVAQIAALSAIAEAPEAGGALQWGLVGGVQPCCQHRRWRRGVLRSLASAATTAGDV